MSQASKMAVAKIFRKTKIKLKPKMRKETIRFKG